MSKALVLHSPLASTIDDTTHNNNPPQLHNNSAAKEQDCLHLLNRCRHNIDGFKQVHARFLKLGFLSSSPFSSSTLLAACAHNSMSYAASVFKAISDPCTFDFNTMIRGYVNESSFEEALCVYIEMIEKAIEPNNFTYPFLLKACAHLKSIRLGEQIHGHVFKLGLESDPFVQNSLINLYGRCGEIKLSSTVFEKLELKTAASWSSMLSACVRCRMWGESLSLFREMNVKVEESGLVSALSACANVRAINLGMSIHGFLLRNLSSLSNVAVLTSLLDMYAKCGCLEKALRVFNTMESRNSLTYTAMISGLALQGEGESALRLFSEMIELGLELDDVVYVSVLTACSHSGLVKEGRRVFEGMVVEPTAEHYGCFVDLLGRAGLLEEALEIIRTMRVVEAEQSVVVWRSFLSACRVHQNVELGKIAARELLKIGTDEGGDYLVMSNMYARARMWEDVARARTEMAFKGLKQTPGFSVVEVKGKTHRFVSQDRFHPQSKEIYKMLHQMEWQLKFEGYSPDTSQVLLDVDEEEKRERLKGHSLKVAIAFSLLCTPLGSTIRIGRNLRMCSDCHTYAKKISMIYEREIVVRDRNRFHLFKGGTCSCKDYW